MPRIIALMLALALTACATSNAMCVVRCVTPASPPCHHHTPAKQKPCDARTNVTPVAIIAAIVCPLEHSATVAPLFLDEDRPAPPSPHPDPPPILRI